MSLDILKSWLIQEQIPVSDPVLDDRWRRASSPNSKEKYWSYIGRERLFHDKPVIDFHAWNHQTGDEFHFKYNNGVSQDPEFQAAARKYREEKSSQIAQDQVLVAKVAKAEWDKLETITRHTPYTERKKININLLMGEIKRQGDILIIPMYDAIGTMWGMQKIYPDGTKRFMQGQKKNGTYYNFRGADGSVLYFCEGFATAASISQAIGGKHPVYVCFDCGNLIHVVSDLRAKLGNDPRFVICADNDKWREKGNIGVEKATEAAQVCGGWLAVPEIGGGRAACPKPTDYNDMMLLDGRDAVVKSLSHAREISVHGPGSSLPDGRGKPIGSDAGLHRQNQPPEPQGSTPSDRGQTDVAGTRASHEEKKTEDGVNKEAEEADKKEKEAAKIKFIVEKIIPKILKCYVGLDHVQYYEITDHSKRELRPFSSHEYLNQKISAEAGTFNLNRIKNSIIRWQLRKDLADIPAPFLWPGEDGWTLKRLDFLPRLEAYPAWQEFLDRLSAPEEFMAFVWSIFEVKNKARQFVYLYDKEGFGGKSTVCNVLADLLGNASTALSGSSTQGDAKRWLTSTLLGKRLVVWPDCKNTLFVMTELLRNIVSGDEVMIERKGDAAFKAKLRVKLIIGSNDEPELTMMRANTSRLIRIDILRSAEKDDPAWEDALREQLPGFLFDCQKMYETLCPGHGQIAVGEITRGLVADSSVDLEERWEEICQRRVEFGETFTASLREIAELRKDEFLNWDRDWGNFKKYLKQHGGGVKRINHGKKGQETIYSGFKLRSHIQPYHRTPTQAE